VTVYVAAAFAEQLGRQYTVESELREFPEITTSSPLPSWNEPSHLRSTAGELVIWVVISLFPVYLQIDTWGV
jgi:hypothetical protein